MTFIECFISYRFHTLRNYDFSDCSFIETTISNTLKSFLESHTSKIFTSLECIRFNQFNSFWNNYISDLRSLLIILFTTKTTIANTSKSFIESHIGETLTIIECVLFYRFNSFWNNYFFDCSLSETLISNIFESFLENYTGKIITILEYTISNRFNSFRNDYFFDLRSIIELLSIVITTETLISNTLKPFLKNYTSKIFTITECILSN